MEPFLFFNYKNDNRLLQFYSTHYVRIVSGREIKTSQIHPISLPQVNNMHMWEQLLSIETGLYSTSFKK